MATLPVYATVEDVKESLDIKETARADKRVMRALQNASRSVEGLCHRRFYPETATRYFDWPNGQYARPWRLWLDDNELISVTTLASGGVTIGSGDYFLEPNTSGPPYNRLEVDLGSSSAFGGGSTHQRDIAVTGLFGYRNDETVVADVDEAMTSGETDLDVTDASGIGVGSVLRVGTERLIVTGRAMKDTGANIDAADSLTANVGDVSITLSTLTGAPAVGEVILVDSERMLVVDRAGLVATVKRAWDGSVLAAHSANADIYALRTLTVERGALGTTAAAMTAGDDVYRWDPPGPIRSLCVAEALVELKQGESAYARVVGSGEAQRESSGRGLADLREQVYRSHGRKARVRAI